MSTKETEMSPEQRRQVTITLCEKAWQEYNLVADWKEIPLATLLRNVLETHHENPAFGNLVVRAKREMEELKTED